MTSLRVQFKPYVQDMWLRNERRVSAPAHVEVANNLDSPLQRRLFLELSLHLREWFRDHIQAANNQSAFASVQSRVSGPIGRPH